MPHAAHTPHRRPGAHPPVRRAAWALVCVATALMSVLMPVLSGCKPAQTPIGADPAKALPLLADATRRMQGNDTTGALEQVRAALKADRSLPGAHLLLGQLHLRLGDGLAAESAYTEAQRLGADRNDWVLPLAVALAGQGRPQALLDEARFDDAALAPQVRTALLLMKAEAATDLGQAAAAQRHIEAARALAPTQAVSWLAEVSTRLRAGQVPEAASAAAKAVALAPQSAAALTARGDVALAEGDRPGALALFEQAVAAAAVAATPADTAAAFEARVSRVGLLLENDAGGQRPGNGSGAASTHTPAGTPLSVETELQALVQAAPRDPRLIYLSALLAERLGKPEAARAALTTVAQTLLRVPPEALRYRPQLLMLGALAHLGLGEPAQARVHLDAALLNPAAAPAAKLLAQSFLAERNLERALGVLENYLKQRPNDQQALLMMVSTQLALGRHTRAASLLQTTLARTDSAALRGMLAAVTISTGGLDTASQEMALALKLNPGNTGLLAALCALQLHSGQPAKALQTAQLLAQREPGNPGWQHLLGVAQLRAGQPQAARGAFEAAIRLDDQFAAPRVALARLLAEAGALDDAQTQLQALLQRQPGHSDALFELGRLAARRGQPAQARPWFEKAQATAGAGDHQATLALVDLHLNQGQLPEANTALRALALRATDDLQVMLMQARLAVANGDGPAARNLLARATGLAGYEAGSLVQVAVLQMQLGQTSGAQYALEKALSDNPRLLPAQALLVDVELRLGEFERAESRVKQLLTDHPRQGLVHALQGDLALARGHGAEKRTGAGPTSAALPATTPATTPATPPAKTPAAPAAKAAPASAATTPSADNSPSPAALATALAAYRRAHQFEPSGAHLLRIHRTLWQTDPAAANASAERWLAQTPGDHAVRRVLADGQARLGQYAAARASYELLAQATPGDAEALNNLAHVLVLLKDPQAVTVAEKALAIAPGDAHVMGVAGWANIAAGQTERGLNWLRAARLRDPLNADTRYFLGAALAAQGRSVDARAELSAALASGQRFLHAADAQALLERLK